MSRNRAIAFITSMVAALAISMGLTAFGATAASAKPAASYPPPPPSLVVNKGVVKYPVEVKATGKKYQSKEKVSITISFLPKGSKRWRTVKTTSAKADKNGKFVYYLKTFAPGLVKITAKGNSSKKSAAAAVYVIDKKKGGGWSIRRASFTTGTTAGTEAVAVADTSDAPANGAWLAIAGLSVMALAGGVVVTRIRRRQRA
jgi:hypothetical protein